MSLMSYQGYFKNGRFLTSENKNIIIPEDTEVIITVLEKKKTKEETINERLKAFDEFWEMVQNNDEELGTEYFETFNQRFNITRELDL